MAETISEHGGSEKIRRDQTGIAAVEIYEIDMPICR
jgi:hypothetical protein